MPVKGKVASVDIIQAYGKIAGSNPAEAVGFLRAKKTFSRSKAVCPMSQICGK